MEEEDYVEQVVQNTV